MRGWWKACVLLASLAQCVLTFFFLRLYSNPSDAERANWLHRSCRMVLRRLGFQIRLRGQPPTSGLIVSNHLSYLDILLFGATLPCIFVSKAEVRSWPMLGLLAALGGTVFIDRTSAVSAAVAATRIQGLLTAGICVLIFPEGTSTDGSTVLRFFSSLFEPAVRAAVAVTPASIAYEAGNAATERDLCYYGDISFGPHLLETLKLPAILGTIHFASSSQIYSNRKEAAAAAHEEVVALRQQAPSNQPQVSVL